MKILKSFRSLKCVEFKRANMDFFMNEKTVPVLFCKQSSVVEIDAAYNHPKVSLLDVFMLRKEVTTPKVSSLIKALTTTL